MSLTTNEMFIAENWQRLYQQAMRHLQAGRILEAIGAHEKLLKARPDLADSWYNLAYLQHRARRFHEALASYRRAFGLGIDCPEEAHLNCAVILAEHLGRVDEAMVEINTALALNPGYIPALLNLGNIHEQCGNRVKALTAYEQVLDLDPTNALALARLPNLRQSGVADLELIFRLEVALTKPGISPLESADIGFGLGKALDSAGEYDRAFFAYCAANLASCLSAKASNFKYDRVEHERFVDRLISLFSQAKSISANFRSTFCPIFICGMFRSGSSLVEQILASHPVVTPGGELDLLPFLVREHMEPVLRGQSDVLDPSRIQDLRSSYLNAVSTQFPGASMVTDKRPDNFLNIGLIKLLFPESKIIHTRRDPIDNCLSVFFLHLAPSMSYAFDLSDIAHWYAQYERLMAHWKSLYGDDIHDVYYDGLVTDFEPTVTDLLNYCGLPWSDSCLEFHKAITTVKTPSAWQVRQPIYTHSSGRWKNYQHHLNSLRDELGR